jgi:hypothetical protein
VGLYIRNEETCRLVRALAALLGVSLTEAVTIAVREELKRLRSDAESGLASQAGVAGDGRNVKPN